MRVFQPAPALEPIKSLQHTAVALAEDILSALLASVEAEPAALTG